MLPQWAQILLSIAAIVTALGVIWTKVVRPLLRFSHSAEEMIPMLRALTLTFRDTPNAFAVLDEIVAQFRTDSGSSLRDVVNRLEDAARANHQSGEVLKVGVESAKQLADQDRQQLLRLIVLLDRLTTKVDSAGTIAAGVARDLAVAQVAVDGVAEDLAVAHRRADEVPHGADPGTAADAAAKQSISEAEDDRR